MLSVLSKYVIKICFNIFLQTFVVDYLACLLLIGNRFLKITRTITTLKHGSRNIKLWHHQYLGSIIETKHVVVLCSYWPFRCIFFDGFPFFRRPFFLLCKISILAGFIRIIFTCDLFALFHNFSETWLTIWLKCPLSSPWQFHHSRTQNREYRSIPGILNKYILYC